MDNQKESRRSFLKATGAGVLTAPAFLSGAPVTNAIKVGLVGCGGRGTGAAAQALQADDYAELTAVADISPEQIEQSLAHITQRAGAKVRVEPERRFLGLDAYQKVIESGVDVVLFATPPGFRPVHLRAAIEAGKHIFCEKPVAVDAPGVRSVLEAVELAKSRNTSLVSGFCWRYSNYIRETFEQVHGGAIGDIVAYYATYYTSPVKPMPPAGDRPAGMSDEEWQIRNWYNFSWLSGDSLVEQAIHSADKIQWAMKDLTPLSCVAVGGRQVPAHGGNIYDHFEVNYEYPNGVRAFLASRQQENCYRENADYILGSKGTCTIGRGPLPRITGESRWRFQGNKNDMYQAEHDALFASIRRDQPINDGVWMTHSTMVGIMGRMAAYTGQQITWEQAMNSQQKLGPDDPMPIPGVTKFI